MVTSKTARARAQWVAQAMEEERLSLERRRRLLGRVYDEVGRYLAAARAIRPLLKELTDFGIGRAEVKRLFSMSDREVAALYESKVSVTRPQEGAQTDCRPDCPPGIEEDDRHDAPAATSSAGAGPYAVPIPGESSLTADASDAMDDSGLVGGSVAITGSIPDPAGYPDSAHSSDVGEFQYGFGGKPHEVGNGEEIPVVTFQGDTDVPASQFGG